MRLVAAEESVRFRPSRADGLPDVREVAIFPDRLEVNSQGRWLTIRFADIGRRQEPLLVSLLKWLSFRRPYLRMVGERDYFHVPRDRFFRWYTDPPLTTYMPDDEDPDYRRSLFPIIHCVMAKGGFHTFDLR